MNIVNTLARERNDRQEREKVAVTDSVTPPKHLKMTPTREVLMEKAAVVVVVVVGGGERLESFTGEGIGTWDPRVGGCCMVQGGGSKSRKR